MADRYFVNGPLGLGPAGLRGDEARHLAAVCRARPGDVVRLFNGDSREYVAEVTAVGRREVTFDVREVEEPRREVGFRLEVAAPLPKGDRAQFLIEKLTELGATSYVPLVTARSVVHPGESKREKLQRYVIESSKQCGRNVLMAVEAPCRWEAYCRRADLPTNRVLAHPGGETGWPAGEDVALAAGPEGGFTEEEVETAQSAGWRVVGLGPRILRVETAVLVLASQSLG